MKSTKYGLQQFPSCQIGRIGLAEKGIHFIQKKIKSLVIFNYSLYVYENNAITIRPCKMQSSKPYKFKDTVGLSFSWGTILLFAQMFQFKIISSKLLLESLPSKTFLFTMHCRALYSTKIFMACKLWGWGFENIRFRNSMAIDKKEIYWHRYDFIQKTLTRH